MRSIRNKPKALGGILLCMIAIFTVYTFIVTSFEDIVMWQRIVPGGVVVAIILLTLGWSKMPTTGFHRHAFFEDFSKQSRLRGIAIFNRIGIFPAILTGYLVYLLIDQTQFMNLHLHPVFQSLSEQFLMIVTIVSGLGLVAYEGDEKEYQYSKNTWSHTYQMVGLSIVLSGVTGLILIEQVGELGWIGLAIANIAMVLVFLVGVMLLEEEE